MFANTIIIPNFKHLVHNSKLYEKTRHYNGDTFFNLLPKDIKNCKDLGIF